MTLDQPDASGKPARECGTCSLCCKVMSVTEIAKPADQWCASARPGRGGCAIYADRPAACRAFRCAWLGGALPDAARPDKIGVVFTETPAGDAVLAYADASRPGVLDRPEVKRIFAAILKAGGRIIVHIGKRRRLIGRGRVRNPYTGELWLDSEAGITEATYDGGPFDAA